MTVKTVNFDDVGHKVVSPIKLAHVVLRTNNFGKMNDFYQTFLGGKIQIEVPGQISFLTYDEEHHRIALIAIPELKAKDKNTCGLEVSPNPFRLSRWGTNTFQHVAFTFKDVSELFLAYRQRKARGIEPYWSINHGPTISMYYRDPDGNNIETQVDCFETEEESNAIMTSPEFAENPIGVEFDPEEMIKRIQSGESFDSLKKRPTIGPRDVNSALHVQ